MSGAARTAVFLLGAVLLGGMLVAAVWRMPEFGNSFHPYRDAAVAAATSHRTPNAVSSVNYDQRGLDTMGEEAILVGAATLLRTESREGTARDREQPAAEPVHVLAATRLVGYLLLPITLLIGVDIVVHGHLSPGGGFQGGVVAATALHLLYVAGDYRALARARPVAWFEFGESAGLGAVVILGLIGIAAGDGFLGNFLPLGRSGQLLSAGTVPVFSIAVGLAVGSGIVVLLAQFLDEYVSATKDPA